MPDTPAIKMWRDKFNLNLNAGRRHDIEATITNLDLWKYVLENWGYFKAGKWKAFSPLSIGKMLSEYERLERNGESNGRA